MKNNIIELHAKIKEMNSLHKKCIDTRTKLEEMEREFFNLKTEVKECQTKFLIDTLEDFAIVPPQNLFELELFNTPKTIGE